MTLPKSNVGQTFYKRNLNVYNLTVYKFGHNIANNFLWDQTSMDRGVVEIGTAVSLRLDEADAAGDTEVDLFSDSTGGQNRNMIFFSMLIHTLSRSANIIKITHRVSIILHKPQTIMSQVKKICDSI